MERHSNALVRDSLSGKQYTGAVLRFVIQRLEWLRLEYWTGHGADKMFIFPPFLSLYAVLS